MYIGWWVMHEGNQRIAFGKKKKVIIKYKSHSSLNTGGEKVFNFV